MCDLDYIPPDVPFYLVTGFAIGRIGKGWLLILRWLLHEVGGGVECAMDMAALAVIHYHHRFLE